VWTSELLFAAAFSNPRANELEVMGENAGDDTLKSDMKSLFKTPNLTVHRLLDHQKLLLHIKDLSKNQDGLPVYQKCVSPNKRTKLVFIEERYKEFATETWPM
jgi:hypothetical protein